MIVFKKQVCCIIFQNIKDNNIGFYFVYVKTQKISIVTENDKSSSNRHLYQLYELKS